MKWNFNLLMSDILWNFNLLMSDIFCGHFFLCFLSKSLGPFMLNVGLAVHLDERGGHFRFFRIQDYFIHFSKTAKL